MRFIYPPLRSRIMGGRLEQDLDQKTIKLFLLNLGLKTHLR